MNELGCKDPSAVFQIPVLPKHFGVSGNFMKTSISIIFLFFYFTSFGQSEYAIDYPTSVDTIVNSIDTIGKELIYDIEFRNKLGQIVKNRFRLIIENHQSKRGYDITDYKTYFFFKNTLVDFEYTFYYNNNQLYKTDYEYDSLGRQTKKNYYSFSRKLIGDTLNKFMSSDYYLNNPLQLPQNGWNSDLYEKRTYNEFGKLIYKANFVKQQKSKFFKTGIEDFFYYNSSNLLIEHQTLTSKPCKNEFCTSDLMQTFEYDCNGRLSRKNWYEDGRYQGYNIYKYSDTSLIEEDYFFSNTHGEYIKGKTNPYSRNNPTTREYILNQQTGKYVDLKNNWTFVICDAAQ